MEDNQPAGARFIIEIPALVEAESGEARSRRRQESARMKPRHILVVDDEPGIRQSLGGVLEDEGYAAESVESGEACLAALAGGAYELVLLDIWLPGMDGLEALARIQEMPFDERPVVVMISGHGTIETAVQSHQAGRVRFSGEAALHRKGRGGGEERAGAPRAGAREPPPEGRTPARATASSAKACR